MGKAVTVNDGSTRNPMTPQLATIVEYLLRHHLLLLASLGAGYAMILACCMSLSGTALEHKVSVKHTGAATATIVGVQIVVGLLQIFVLPRTSLVSVAATCAVMAAFIFAIRVLT